MAQNFMWGSGAMEATNLGRWWKKISGEGLTYKSVPRYIHGTYECLHPRSELGIKYFPYKNEMTYNGAFVPSISDALYTHYFPRQLNDDERVAYIAEKSQRTEEEVAQEIFTMRRMRMFCAQAMRMKSMNKMITPPQGMQYDQLERKYHHATVDAARMLSGSMHNNHTFDPTLVYSTRYGIGDSIDFLVEKNLRSALQYLMLDVVVDRGIPKARLPGVNGDAKFPLQKLEPCVWNYYKLKYSVYAHIIKQEGYVTDHYFDSGHAYQGAIMHFRPTMAGEIIPELHIVEVDMALGKEWLDHYHQNYVQPLKQETRAGM